METFLNLFVAINAIVVFITVKYIFEIIVLDTRMKKWIIEIGKCTFGVYLIHVWILRDIPFFKTIWFSIEQNTIIGRYFGIYLSCVLCFVICTIIIYFLRKLPLVRELF